jgi:hypothetical protein
VATARGRGRQGIAWNPQRACQFEPRRQRRGVGIDVADDGKHLPTIIFLHGGPYARDTDEFDYWTEYFVSRGHAVLQPNFRGSVGYELYMYQFGKFTRARIARGDALDANSPIEHVDEFGIPLLIVHGVRTARSASSSPRISSPHWRKPVNRISTFSSRAGTTT